MCSFNTFDEYMYFVEDLVISQYLGMCSFNFKRANGFYLRPEEVISQYLGMCSFNLMHFYAKNNSYKIVISQYLGMCSFNPKLIRQFLRTIQLFPSLSWCVLLIGAAAIGWGVTAASLFPSISGCVLLILSPEPLENTGLLRRFARQNLFRWVRVFSSW